MDKTGLICRECADEHYKRWQANNKNTLILPGNWCKMQFTDGENTEYMWVLVTLAEKGKFTGTLDNDPVFLTNVKCSDEISFVREDIYDYLKSTAG